MKLRDWLVLKGYSQEEFAQQIDVTQQAVATYVLETSIPRKPTMLRIIDVTSGAVTPADFYQ